ncbi:hypothetical protein RJ639_026556 [Escallonia herrerae]|uniref:Reverse transcriptase/retrotransposon-derived protein RNase H-like domain-containing protein n=1 Tax=Escallonia herrerae TaxID=1293975 RepID=A0AA88UXN8_9ASTE|nr:hypothetical protein RJ639_026556 [Escallonia herrerae]
MKFPTPQGVGVIKGDQEATRKYYIASCKVETFNIDDQRDGQLMKRATPIKKLVSIPLKDRDNEHLLRIGSTLDLTIRDQLTAFLRSNADVFTWSAADMPGIDPSVINHRLSVDPTHKSALKNIKNFEWTTECQTSFEALKKYLASLPLFSKPIEGEMLFLYLTVTNFAVSAVLVREQDIKQFPIYNVSKVLQGAELRYPPIEKLAFALLIAARKLRLYFQSHTITVLMDRPLRRILHKPDLSGRLVPWSVELGEFDIQYKPRPSIKGQALADFIVECTLPIDEAEPHGLWVEELPKIIWAYHTTTCTATGETPFSLAFGTEALIPLEIGLPSVRLITYNPNTNDDSLRSNLDLLEEKRDQAAIRLAAYQHRVAKFFDKRVQPRAFRVGDLILRLIDVSVPRDAIGKLSPNWEGPYRVVKLGGPGSYHLETLDGKAIPRTWNARTLRRYYS